MLPFILQWPSRVLAVAFPHWQLSHRRQILSKFPEDWERKCELLCVSFHYCYVNICSWVHQDNQLAELLLQSVTLNHCRRRHNKMTSLKKLQSNLKQLKTMWENLTEIWHFLFLFFSFGVSTQIFYVQFENSQKDRWMATHLTSSHKYKSTNVCVCICNVWLQMPLAQTYLSLGQHTLSFSSEIKFGTWVWYSQLHNTTPTQPFSRLKKVNRAGMERTRIRFYRPLVCSLQASSEHFLH